MILAAPAGVESWTLADLFGIRGDLSPAMSRVGDFGDSPRLFRALSLAAASALAIALECFRTMSSMLITVGFGRAGLLGITGPALVRSDGSLWADVVVATEVVFGSICRVLGGARCDCWLCGCRESLDLRRLELDIFLSFCSSSPTDSSSLDTSLSDFFDRFEMTLAAVGKSEEKSV